MTPGIYNYGNQYRGDTLDETSFALTSSGLPINLTDVAIKVQFRLPFHGKVVKELTVGSGITVANPSTGVISIDAFILDWDPGSYLYDVEFTYPTGVIKTYIKGTINLISDNTI